MPGPKGPRQGTAPKGGGHRIRPFWGYVSTMRVDAQAAPSAFAICYYKQLRPTESRKASLSRPVVWMVRAAPRVRHVERRESSMRRSRTLLLSPVLALL